MSRVECRGLVDIAVVVPRVPAGESAAAAYAAVAAAEVRPRSPPLPFPSLPPVPQEPSPPKRAPARRHGVKTLLFAPSALVVALFAPIAVCSVLPGKHVFGQEAWTVWVGVLGT